MKFIKSIFIVVFFLSCGNIFAQKTIEHKVVSGDSFYSIAKKYNVEEEAIYKLNPNLKGKVLQLNTIIIIPNDKKSKIKGDNKTAKNKSDVYEVQSGDSFYSIALNNDLTVDDLKKYNPDVSPKNLQIGQKINLKPVKTKKTKVEKEDRIVENSSNDNAFHVVKKGETMSSISKKYGLKLADLLEMNKSLGTNLQIGDKVAIKKENLSIVEVDKPVDSSSNGLIAESNTSDDDVEEADDSGEITHLVKKGETASSIARHYNVKLKELKKLNPRVGDKLSVGHKLIIKKGNVNNNIVVAEEESIEDIAPMSVENVTKADQLIAIASQNIGTRYRGGGKTEEGFDCSGLMCYTFDKLQISLPRSSSSQSEIGKKIKRKNAQKGDLIFFSTNGRGTINHVGMITEIYEDDIRFIHSSVSAGVIISSINEAYYTKRFKKIVRVLHDYQ